PSGIAVDCLKLSRAQRPMPLRLARGIQAEPDNRAIWVSASITMADVQEQSGAAVQDRMLAYVRDYPGCSSKAVQLAAGARRELALVEFSALVESGKIANSGREKAAKWYAVQ